MLISVHPQNEADVMPRQFFVPSFAYHWGVTCEQCCVTNRIRYGRAGRGNRTEEPIRLYINFRLLLSESKTTYAKNCDSKNGFRFGRCWEALCFDTVANEYECSPRLFSVALKGGVSEITRCGFNFIWQKRPERSLFCFYLILQMLCLLKFKNIFEWLLWHLRIKLIAKAHTHGTPLRQYTKIMKGKYHVT